MPTVSDYVTIVGSGDRVQIGGSGGEQSWEDYFGTGGRSTGQQDAHILVEFSGLSDGNKARVQLNDNGIGSLKGYDDGNSHTQILSFPDERLEDGRNEVQINEVETGSGDDAFVIENMVCMFHQVA